MTTPREIKAVLYSCDWKTTRGLCSLHPGTLYKHEWKKSHPLFVEEGGRYGIACDVRFRNGILQGGWGIDDADKRQHCDINVYQPNPGQKLFAVGQLVRVEYLKGGGKDFTGGDWVLAVSDDGRRLFIVPGKQRTQGVVANPVHFWTQSRANPSPNPVADPDLRKLIKYNIDGVLDELLAAEHHAIEAYGEVPDKTWCHEKALRQSGRHHGKELFEHLSSAGEKALATKAMDIKKRIDVAIEAKTMDVGIIRNIRNDFRAAFLPETQCGSGVCAHDVSAPKVHTNPAAPVPSEGVALWQSPYCGHCRRVEAALTSAGISYTPIDVTQHGQLARERGVTATPFLEFYEHGQVRSELLGERDAKTLKHWYEEVSA